VKKLEWNYNLAKRAFRRRFPGESRSVRTSKEGVYYFIQRRKASFLFEANESNLKHFQGRMYLVSLEVIRYNYNRDFIVVGFVQDEKVMQDVLGISLKNRRLTNDHI
jgi:hypothetical protein